jgi:hypothetical protein
MARGEKLHNAEMSHVAVKVGDHGDVSIVDRGSSMFNAESSISAQFYSRISSGLEIKVSTLIIFISASYKLNVAANVSYQ